MALRSSDRYERELMLYARSGAVVSACVFAEWKLGVTSMLNVCDISIAISPPVIDGAAAILPDAGASGIARTHISGDTVDAIASAQLNVEALPSLIALSTTPMTRSAAKAGFVTLPL